jgi:hypothetical protein
MKIFSKPYSLARLEPTNQLRLPSFSGFTCRCGGLFCSLHRYSDKHECSFDYKELGAEQIRKSNPVVVASKVQKI